jgi:hypothetical protein
LSLRVSWLFDGTCTKVRSAGVRKGMMQSLPRGN